MPVFSLLCANSACSATYELHAPATDYPPQFCEFCGGPLDEYQERYRTREDALKGHYHAVAQCYLALLANRWTLTLAVAAATVLTAWLASGWGGTR